jgi:hypothetical protein
VTFLLLKAADVYARNGRVEADFYDSAQQADPRDCRVCVLGAIAVGAGLDPDMWIWTANASSLASRPARAEAFAAARALAEYVDLLPDGEVVSESELIALIGGWHDETSGWDVLCAMRASAERRLS